MKPFVPEKLPLGGINWEQLIPRIGQANRAIAEYNGVLYGISNPAILLSPMTTQEAVMSSRIEGTQASLGDVLKFEAGEVPSENARHLDIQEIINYRRALVRAEEELQSRPFNLNLLLRCHEILLASVRGNNKSRGLFRTELNYIGAPGSSIEQAQFVPPDPALVPELLDNWEKYYHEDRQEEQRDPLVQLAIVHAQFEIIHPFLDGNGRLGRMLVPLFLYEKKILSRPMFYLSAYLEQHRDEYVDRLRALGQQPSSWDDWISFFLKALTEQARVNTTKAREIMDLYDRLKARMIQLTHSPYAVPMLDFLFEKPIFKSSQLEGISGNPSRPTISNLLSKLTQGGILKVMAKGSGRRAQTYVFPELLNLCEGKEIF